MPQWYNTKIRWSISGYNPKYHWLGRYPAPAIPLPQNHNAHQKFCKETDRPQRLAICHPHTHTQTYTQAHKKTGLFPLRGIKIKLHPEKTCDMQIYHGRRRQKETQANPGERMENKSLNDWKLWWMNMLASNPGEDEGFIHHFPSVGFANHCKFQALVLQDKTSQTYGLINPHLCIESWNPRCRRPQGYVYLKYMYICIDDGHSSQHCPSIRPYYVCGGIPIKKCSGSSWECFAAFH